MQTPQRSAASRLPHYPTATIGRERDRASVAGLLERSRLVTLAGTGGIGKTRLAVEVASHLEPAPADGIWFVDLASIGEADLVAGTVAAAMGLELPSHREPLEALVATLRPMRALIVLDNCEHVLGDAGRVASALLEAAPNLRILATSREPLGVAGEAVARLGTLDEAAAIELFVARAMQADPQFSMGGRNAPFVREICRRLDGIALAIELAAVGVRVMPLGQLRARLDGRFKLMLAEHRAVHLPRHQTMQALIDWSHELLTGPQRVLFRRLAVFGGSFSSDAAAHVARGSEIDEDAARRIVAELAEKSMIVSAGDEPARCRMLESIKQYALEHLLQAGEEPAARATHAAYFLDRALDAHASFGTGSEEAWMTAYGPDLDNFRAALDWGRERDVGLASGLAAALPEFWEYHNLAAEGLRRSEAVLAAYEDPSDPATVPLLLAIAELALAARVYRRSLETSERAIALSEGRRDEAAIAQGRRIAGRSRYLLGIQPELSLPELRAALEYARAHDGAYGVARATRDYASALAQVDPNEGRRLLLEALELARTAAWPRLTIHVEINVAEREFRSGNVAAAADRAREVIAMLRERRSPLQLGHALTNLASYLAMAQQYDDALAAAREAIEIGRAHETHNYVALPMQALGVVIAARGNAGTAARLLGFADAFYDRYAMKREMTEEIVHAKLVELLRAKLDDLALERERSAGRQLSDDAAAELAFS